jgi:chromosome segregation ATPase
MTGEKPKEKRQDTPPAEPPAGETPPAEEVTLEAVMEKITAIEGTVNSLSERLTKLEGGKTEEPPAEAPPAEAPPAGAGAEPEETKGKENVDEGDKQLESAHARIKELESELAKAKGESSEPRSGAPADAGELIEVPDDMRSFDADQVEYLYQKQKTALRQR